MRPLMKANIDRITYFFVSVVFLGWGSSVFFDKLAANKLGNRGLSIYVIALLPSLLVTLFYLLWGYKWFGYDRIGVVWVTLSYVFNIIALVAYYLVFTKTDASWASAVTALYPVFTIILAIIFLHEKLSLTRFIGIFLAMLAVVFLSF